MLHRQYASVIADAQTRSLLFFSPYLHIRPMPLPPAPFHNTSRISQDLLRYLVRRHGVKSETALSPQQSLHPPYQSTPVHVTSHKPDDLLTLSPDILPNCYKVLFCVLLNIESHVPSPNDDDDGTGPVRKQSERHILPST